MKSSNTKMSPWALCLLLLLAFPMLHAAANDPTPPPPCPLAPPTSVTVTDVSTNSLTAAWTAVPGALMYKVTVKNLNTNLIIATVYTANTTKFINGLPSNTPLRVGVSASRCNTQNPANFGSEKTTETRTLKYIVAEIVVGKSELPRTHTAPWSVSGEAIPTNPSVAPSWDYYQAKVTGKKDNEPWSCRFSIVATCMDNSSTGAGFYIFVDTEETQNVSYTTLQPLSTAEFRCRGVLLFTVTSATLFSANQAGTTDIIFPSPSGGVVIDTFKSNSGATWWNESPPSGFICAGGDSNFGGGSEDRDASASTAAASGQAASLTPNPTTDRVDLQFHLSAASEVVVNLYDAAGRAVQQVTPQQAMPEGQNRLALDVSALPPGFYFVRLSSAQGMETLTLVKQ